MRTTLTFRFLSTVVLLLPCCGIAKADFTVFSQPPGPGSHSLATSSTVNNLGGFPGVRTADDFQLALTADIGAVDWWGKSNSGGSAFQISFYADAGDLPGAVLSTLSVSAVSTTVFPGSVFDPVFLYSATLSTPFHALAGTQYWISIFNAAPDASWNWLAANVGGLGPAQMFIGGAWLLDPARREVAFELDAVPEPASLLLAATALIAIAGARRWKRRTAASLPA